MTDGAKSNTAYGGENSFFKCARQDSNLQPSDSKSEDIGLQIKQDKALTEESQNVLASFLAQLPREYSDLIELFKAWPALPLPN